MVFGRLHPDGPTACVVSASRAVLAFSRALAGPRPRMHAQGRPLIAAKYMPILWTKFLIGGPWRAGRRAVAKALEDTLDRGGWTYLDLYQASLWEG